ncbi:hypothetical protein KCV07_g8180, partial [Aureobasidium melanogenum]
MLKIASSKLVVYATVAINAITLIISIALLVVSAYWTARPGPHVYYSTFWTISASACLMFQTAELSSVVLFASRHGRVYEIFRVVHLAICVLTGFITGVCHAIVSKSDTAAIDFLSCFQGLVGLVYYRLIVNRKSEDLFEGIRLIDTLHIDRCSPKSDNVMSSTDEVEQASSKKVQRRTCANRAITNVNVLLLVVHACLLVLSTSGSVQLALLYRFANPGTVVKVTLPTGQATNVNHFCTSVENSVGPTIWFEADAAHGVLDFIGVQTILAQDYNRTSCSYDPPNFGWSDNLPSSLDDFYSYFTPLLRALGQQDEPKILVGWGDGAHNALMHALENVYVTRQLVLMDSSPDGIEWFDAQRANNWTEKQMLEYRQTDLQGRISLVQLILGVAIPWGLLPIFIPANSTGYFDASLYPMYNAQSRKENMWANQYFGLRQMAAESINKYLVNTTVPEGMTISALMTYNAGTDPASDGFYRQEKLGMLNNIAGKNVTDNVVCSRTRSPFIELLASEVTAVCYCIGTPATNEKQSAAAKSASYKGLSVQKCTTKLTAEFSEPWNFCEFYTRVTRTSSPFKAFSAPQLLELCDCIEGSTSTTSSKKHKTTSTSSSSKKTGSKTSSVTTSSKSSSLTSSSLSSSLSLSRSTATDFPITATISSISTSTVNNTTLIDTLTSSTFNSPSTSASSNTTSSTLSAATSNTTTTSSTSYGNGTNSTVSLDPTASSNTTSSTFVPVNVTSSISSSITTPIATGFSSGFPTSSGTSGSPYGNSTSSTPVVGPTMPISTANATSINSTISVPVVIGVPTDIVDTSSAASSGFSSSVSVSGAPYGNGTSGTPTVGPTAPIYTGNPSSANSTSSVSVIIGVPTDITNPSSGGTSFSSVATSGAPYGNGTGSAPIVGPTAPVTTASPIAINTTSSAPTSVFNSTSSTASSGFSSSVSSSGAPYGNGTSSTISFGPTAPFSTGVFPSTAIGTNSTIATPSITANTTSSLASSGFPSSTSASGAPYGNGTSSAPTLYPTAPIDTGSFNTSTVVSANSTISVPTKGVNSTSAASSGFSSSVPTSGAPYGNSTGSAPTVGPTAPIPTGTLSIPSIVDVTNSTASSALTFSTFVPSGGISSSAISSGAPYGNSSSTPASSGPTAPVTTSASSTSISSSPAVSASNGTSTFVPSSTFSVGPVNATTTGSSNSTTAQSASTTVSQSSINATVIGPVTTSASSSAFNTTPVTTSASSSSSISQTTTSSISSSSSSATATQSSTPSQASNLNGNRVFISRTNLAYGNLALESTQDGENDYATVYTRRQRPTLGYTFDQTSGYLYLGNSKNVLSYAVPSFRSDSVQLATLTQDYLNTYPESWSPLKCTASDAGTLACSVTVKATRFRRRSVTYSAFIAVPREGQNAADIYLYAANQIDGRPLGASQVSLMLSKD